MTVRKWQEKTVFCGKDQLYFIGMTDENVNLVDPGYQNADAYREDAKNMLIEFTEYQYERELENGIASNLIAESTYQEIPESLVEDYKSSLKTDFENAAAAAGVSLEEYMANTYYISADSLEDELGKIAERCAKEGLALQRSQTRREFRGRMKNLMRRLRNITSAAGDTGEEPEKENVRVNLLYDKVYEFLTDIYSA